MFGHGRPPFGEMRGSKVMDTSTEVKKLDASNTSFCIKHGFLSMTKTE